MPRPGPLQDLPLDRLLPHPPSRPHKRPLSPGGPSLYSPAKRRILNQEGIFSPEKTIKSPISTRATPSRFIDVLSGPSSPARKLDFGVLKHAVKVPGVEATPVHQTSTSNRLAPSPELKHNPQPPWPDDDMDDYFNMPTSSSSRSSTIPISVPREMLPPPDPQSIPISVPREMPPPLDPQSVHYPGFRVHCDAHILLTSVHDDLGTLSLIDNNKDAQKENVAPRRKAHKMATALNADLKSPLFSPDARKREMGKLGKAKSTPVMPRKFPGSDRGDSGNSPTPHRLGIGLTLATTSSTPRAMEKERGEMRRALQDEVDDADEDEDGDA